MLHHKIFRIHNFYLSLAFQSSFKRRTTLISMSMDNNFVRTFELTLLNLTITVSRLTEADIMIWEAYKEHILSEMRARENEALANENEEMQ